MVKAEIATTVFTKRRHHLDGRLLILFIVAFAAAAIYGFTNLKDSEETYAADLSKFDPGNIISDYTMSNNRSMTEQEIQEFLNSKIKCNHSIKSEPYMTQIDGEIWGYTSASGKQITFHVKDDKFVCLNTETFGEGTEINVENGETAAHIIWQAGQDYQINPQVLIVLLQKEQALITDDAPNNIQYRSATGYGCPDTAACSKEYYGFKNQVRKAAAMFHTVLTGGWTNYPVGKNYVQYNPNSRCGGSTVDIKNLATSSLYRYTPYQPNASALAAGYGAGDSCGAYGNRNFFLYFSDWFGDPTYSADTDGLIIKYKSLTEAQKKSLGDQVGDIKSNETTGIRWIEYKNGSIVGNNQYGYFISMGKTRTVWSKNGFEGGKLGFPLSDVETNSETGISYQKYQNGYIVGSDKTGYYISEGDIRKVWQKHGFEGGELGFPTSNIQSNSKTGIYYQDYQNGCIVGNETYGYYVSMGKSRAVWAKAGFEGGKLGFPLSDVQSNSETGVYYQEYQNGFIVGSEQTGYFISEGKIRNVWAKNGFEGGSLGFPLSNIENNSKTGIYYQKYQNGYIVGNDKNGYYVSIGETRKVWERQGFEGGSLGFPLSDIQTNKETGIYYQQYQGGFIVGKDSTGYYISTGKIRDLWASKGFEGGSLGFPTSGITTSGSVQSQKYQNGTVYYNTSTGAVYIR